MLGVTTFDLTIDFSTTRESWRAWMEVISAFVEFRVPDQHVVNDFVEELTGIHTVSYDCCPELHMCYTGKYADLDKCPYCNHARWKGSGTS